MAAALGARRQGLSAAIDVVGAGRAAIPRGRAVLFGARSGAGPCAATSLAALGTQLAEIGAPLVLELLASLGVAPGRVMAVGVHDPGVWEYHQSEPAGYLGLCDSARLAEATGLNVIDAFPARDLAMAARADR